MKTIVTHTSPDLDAITSSWLIHRFLPGWKKAEFEFVSAGKTLNDQPPDSNSEILHVDTGYGKFDHHQTDKQTCASRLVFDYLLKNDHIRKNDAPALDRLVDVVNRYDHFLEVYLENSDDDINDFSLNILIDGLKIKKQNNLEVLLYVETALDALFVNFKNKVNAEMALESGFEFTSVWGKTLALESENDEVMKLGFKKGYDMIIRKSILQGSVRIKLNPKINHPLKPLEKPIKQADPKATWFYHVSGRMFLNGSSKTPSAVPSSLSLKRIIQIVKEIS